MEEIENIKNELNEIKTARDNIKTALQNEGETVTDDIRTYANTIPNVNKVKTVNGVNADTNKNVQIDASNINVDETAGTKQTVKAKLEALGIEIQNITVPEYSIKESTTTAGYSKTYSLTKDGAEVGVKVNIPKDLVINKGTVKVVATAGTPYESAVVGDKYLDIELNDPTKDHIYIPVKELVDVYTAGDGIEISASNVIKSKNSNLVNGSAIGSLRSVGSTIENDTYTIGSNATAIGSGTKASGGNSFASNYNTIASGYHAHAEGFQSTASGHTSHAEGYGTEASGTNGSHSEGRSTIAKGSSQHVQGKFNVEDTENKYAHIVGNGNNNGGVVSKSNAHTLDWNGIAWFADSVKVGGTGQDDTNAKQLATQEYVNNSIVTYTAGRGIVINDSNAIENLIAPILLDSSDANFNNDFIDMLFNYMDENGEKGAILVFYIDGYEFIMNGNILNMSNIMYLSSNIYNSSYLLINVLDAATNGDVQIKKIHLNPIESILDVSGITSTNRYVELPYTSEDLDVYLNGEKLLCTSSVGGNETDDIKNNYSCYTYYNAGSGTTKLYFTSDYVIESTDKLVVRQYGVSENYVKG